MKYITFLVIFMCFMNINARSKKSAVSDSITSEEAAILNIVASKHGVKYDFSSKKVAFYTGPGGDARRSKYDFLPICRAIDEDGEYDPTSYFTPRIYLFDEEEKSKADGYDAVIVYGSVKQFPSKKALIRRLHRRKFFFSVW